MLKKTIRLGLIELLIGETWGRRAPAHKSSVSTCARGVCDVGEIAG